MLAGILASAGAAPTGPQALVLTGPSGIGKSTVWAAGVRAAAVAGIHVLQCRRSEPESTLAFSALTDLLDELPETVMDTLPPVQRDALAMALLRHPDRTAPDPRALRAAVLGAVRRLTMDRPVLLAVDGMQWLDPDTAGVLDYLIQRVGDLPVVFIGTARTGTGPFRIDRALPHDRVTHLELPALVPAALRKLVLRATARALPRPDLLRLHALTDGNPRHAIALAPTLGQQPPRIPDHLVDQPVRALPAPIRRVLLHVAALADPRESTVRAALPDCPDAVADAEELGVVRVEHGRVRPVHPLLPAAAYAEVSAEARRAVHRRLAELVTSPDERLRHQALGIDQPDEQLAYLLDRAAVAARRRGDSITAARLWELAAARTPDHQPADRHRRQVRAARCLFQAGDPARAEELLTAAASSAERADVALDLAEIAFAMAGSVRATALCQAGGGLDAQLRLAWFASHDPGQQRAAAASALRLAGPGHPTARAFAALFGVGGSTPLPTPPAGRSWEARHARIASAEWLKLTAPAAARERFRAEHRHAAEAGDDTTVARVLAHLAELDLWMGDVAGAVSAATGAIELAEQTGQPRTLAHALHTVAVVAARQGAVDVAMAAVDRGRRLTDDPAVVAAHHHVLGSVHMAAGNPARADSEFTRAETLLTRVAARTPMGFLLRLDQIEVAIARQDLARAHELQGELSAMLGPWAAAAAAQADAAVKLALGEPAAEAAERALAGYRTLALPFESGRTLLLLGATQRAGKQRAAARASLTTARCEFDRLGATWWSARADAELDRCGTRRGAGDDLTPTEEHVARLVAGGLSNREAAALAYLSPKTVEVNLSRVYRKLGVRNRQELARCERFRDLDPIAG